MEKKRIERLSLTRATLSHSLRAVTLLYSAVACGPAPVGDEVASTVRLELGETPDFGVAKIAGPGSAGMVAAGDVNGDGRTDLITENLFDQLGDFDVLLGNGAGGFAPASSFLLGGFGPAHGIALADVNQDGPLDFVAVSQSGVWLLFGDGTGSFSPPTVLAFEGGLTGYAGNHALTLVDLNADGIDEIVVATVDWRSVFDHNTRLVVLRGLGGGTFAAPEYHASPVAGRFTPFSIASADWNTDGYTDVAVGEFSDGAAPDHVTLFLADGAGGFVDVRPFSLSPGTRPLRLLPGDFNADGRIDLALRSGDVRVLLGADAVILGPEIVSNGLPDFGQTGETNVEDRDGDGYLDIVSAPSGALVSILRGDGQGRFATWREFDVGLFYEHGVFADVTGDGRSDFVANGSTHLSALIAEPGGAFRAGRIDPVAGAAHVLTGWFDSDELEDVVVLAWREDNGPTIESLRGVGGGALGVPTTTVLTLSPSEASPNRQVGASGDFNEDGLADLALVSIEQVTPDVWDARLQLWTGSALGTFSLAGSTSLGAEARPVDIAVGDLNRDGHADVAAIYPQYDEILPGEWVLRGIMAVSLGDGQGGLGVPSESRVFDDDATAPVGLTFADLDRDGSLDAAVSGTGLFRQTDGLGSVTLALGDGAGGFLPSTHLPAGNRAGGIVAADFNLDGNPDIAVGADDAAFDFFPTRAFVRWWLGDGSGGMGAPVDSADIDWGSPLEPCRAMTLVAGDFNGDDLVDLVLGGQLLESNSSGEAGFLPLLLGTGSGFAPPTPIGTVSFGHFAAGDLDVDGRWDVVSSSQYLTTVLNFTASENTPVTTNLAIRPIDPTRGTAPALITFSFIAQGGMTTVRSGTYGPLPPFGFKLGTPAEYFHIYTTALFSGFIDICIDYNPLSYLNPADVRLFHYDNGVWNDTTTTNDSANGRICGQTLSLSPFALVEPIPDEPEEIILTATQDAVVRRNEPNLNGGANAWLTVSNDNRVLVGFDLSGVDVSRVESARLVMTVGDVDGVGRGVVVDAHRVTEPWTEGNGRNGIRNELGSGEGATWICASDTNIANRRPDCASRWRGGSTVTSTSGGVVHSRRVLNEVAWEVTADLAAASPAVGWLVRLRREQDNWRVRYHARDTGAFGPKLVIRYTR